MQQGAASEQDGSVDAELIAVIVAVTNAEPRVLTIQGGTALPSGPFATEHRSLQASLRSRVERQTRHPLGYVEQLYTFADRDRTAPGRRAVSISYLGLARENPREPGRPDSSGVGWQDWYRYFPWEDRRDPDVAPATPLVAALQSWADAASDAMLRWQRRSRAAINFGLDGHAWNEDLVLQRYETLWEAGLVPEAGGTTPGGTTPGGTTSSGTTSPGQPMAHDHRRILATGIARLRGKIKYRPLVFELMPPEFTLGQLQRSVEALAGRRLHKQNFRRLVEQQDLVEETGRSTMETGGRPAKLFRFRKSLLVERAVAGTKLPLAR